MNTTAQKREKVKPERKCRLETEGGRTVLSMTVITRGPRIGERKEVFRYALRSLDGGHGLAFRFEKLDHLEDGEPTNYDVQLDSEGHSCECRGFLKHCHCKHVESLVALVENGVL